MTKWLLYGHRTRAERYVCSLSDANFLFCIESARTNKRHHHHHTSLTDRGQLSSHTCASTKIHFSSTLLANAHSGKDSSVSLRASRESQWCGDGGGACTLALRTSSLLSTFASSVCDVVCPRLLSLLHKCSGSVMNANRTAGTGGPP